MTVVTFHVLGTPAPQGDKSAIVIGGKPRLIEGKRGAQRERHGNWRSAVAEAARDALATHGLTAALDGPLHLTVTFRFSMPTSRPRKVREHGSGWKTSAPDLDKLLRATGDALVAGGLIVDDRLLAEITARKVETVGWTGAEIRLETIEEAPAVNVASDREAPARDTIDVACGKVWDYRRRPCEAWGAPGSHGCRKLPGHDGSHVCLCGAVAAIEEAP